MKRTFAVPDDLENVKKLVLNVIINAIPTGWAILRGILRAPKQMLDSGEASASTKWVFGSEISQMIAPAKNGEVAAFFGSLFENKKPGSVFFGECGGYCEVMPMKQSKLMTTHLLQLDYRGRLTFEWRQCEHTGERPDFRFEISLPTDDPNAPLTFSIESNREDLEGGGTIVPLINICERLELLETK